MRKILFLLFVNVFPLFVLVAQESGHTSSPSTKPQKEQIDKDLFPEKSTSDFRSTFMKMVWSLIALIALLFLTFWLFRRLSKMRLHQANQLKNIKILEKRAISPKTCLYLIETEGDKVLISESQLEVRLINKLSTKIIKEHQ